MKVLFLLMFSICVFCSKIEQQHALVKYANSKYIKDIKILTGRSQRNEPYRTNCTMTTLYSFGNNVTMVIAYKLSGVQFTWKIKSCEILQMKWLYDYLKSVSNDYNHGCPFPAQTYRVYNMEFPPKNTPLPIPKGDTTVVFKYIITTTEELICEIHLDLLVK